MAVSVTPIRAGILTDYLLGGALTLKNGRIDKYYFEGGFARAFETSATTDRFVFYYYNQDHLGNNREVVDIKGRIHQVTNYYPFGAPYADGNAIKGESLQPYKYNGKELDLMHGLNTYDYGARQYNPVMARWDRVDPLAEKDSGTSPYVYCCNNPIRFIDPDGMWSWDSNGNLVAQKGDNVNTMAKYLGTSSSNALQILNRCGVSTNSNGSSNLLAGQVLNKSNLWVGTRSKNGTVVNNTKEAVAHYFFGNGQPADVGDQSTKELLSSDKFQSKLHKITTQEVESNGYFSVDLTDKTFHIGRTNVDYNITSNGTSNAVTFTLFSRDGFWDPDLIDEKCLGNKLGVSFCQPDGIGPNLERGGTPYEYKTRSRTFFFKPIE